MSSAVAPLMAISEQATRPSVASSSSGSRRRRHSRGTSGGGGSEAGWIGRGAQLRLLGAGVELAVPRHRTTARGSGAPRVPQFPRRSRPSRSVTTTTIGLPPSLHEAGVPGLIGVRLALGGAGLAVDRVLVREALEDVGRRAAVGSLAARVQAVEHDRRGHAGSILTLRRGLLRQLLDRDAVAVLDRLAEVRA